MHMTRTRQGQHPAGRRPAGEAAELRGRSSQELGENLIKAASAREALEHLLKNDVAVVLVDVCMPELDGFELAAMIREHPRFQKTAIIFISAIHLTDVDRLRGYEMGAVDYVPVPVVPEVLRAKVRVFAELYRKTRQLEQLNAELEQRVAERTAELEASTARLLQSEQRRSLALAAGKMGSWDWDLVNGDCIWDEGQYRIFGVDPATLRGDRRQHPGADPSRGLASICRSAIEPASQNDAEPTRPSFASVGPTARCAGASAPRRRASTRPATSCASAASPSTSPTARKPRSARRCWRARSITAPKRAGAGAIDRAADAGGHHQGLYRRGGGADQRAVARAHMLLAAEPLAGRRPRAAGRRGACALSRGRRRTDHDRRTRRIARTAHRADARAGAARTRPPTRPNMARCPSCRDASG